MPSTLARERRDDDRIRRPSSVPRPPPTQSRVPVPPTLTTRRLLLRPFTLDDAPAVQRLLSTWEAVRYTGSYPHPYPDGEAERWIARQTAPMAEGTLLRLAVTARDDGTLLGSGELVLEPEQRRAELGYWIGGPYTGRGYAVETAHVLLRHAFGMMGLHRVQARVFVENAPSAAVLRRVGMRCEARLRAHGWRWNVLHDVDCYGILAGESPVSTTTTGENG